MLSPAPFCNAFPERESSIKCQFFHSSFFGVFWQTGLPLESTLSASVVTNFNAVTILPTNFTILSQYRLSPNLQMSRSLSQDCLPNRRTFYIIQPSISSAKIEIVKLVTWGAIARPRMSRTEIQSLVALKWNNTSRGHCNVQIQNRKTDTK